MQVYVLSTCDTCRKALKWLQQQNITYTPHDIRKDGIPGDIISAAINALGWERVLNRRSTTWRNLDASKRLDMDAQKAASLITANPTLMKRPLFISGNTYIAGFDKSAREQLEGLVK